MIRTLGLGVACAVALLAAAPGGARADDQSALLSDLHRFSQLRSFRMHVVEVTPLGRSVKDIIYVAPDKVRVALGDTGLVVVVIANNVWLRGVDGKWIKAKRSSQDLLAAVRDTTAFADDLSDKSVRLLGSPHLDGVPTRLYQIDVLRKAGYSVKTTRVWVGTADGYAHRIEERNGPYLATTTYSDYNAPLSVSAQ